MSAPASAPASRWRVLGTTAVLLLFLGLFAHLGRGLLTKTVDGDARQREYFGAAALPFDLALAEAVQLPSGEEVVRFARAEEAAGPSEALLIRYPKRKAVEALLQNNYSGDLGQRIKEWEREPKYEWSATVKRDDLEWGAWSTKWLVARSFHEGGGWHEEARVDLSTKDRPLVLFVHWPDGAPADEKDVRVLLDIFQMPAEG
jgi:hypothetical protein